MISPADFLSLVAGLIFFELTSRYIATRKPRDTSLKSVRPWYGRDAASATHRRPSMPTLVLPMAAAAAVAFVPHQFPLYFVLGVLLAVVRSLLVWYVFPLVFRVRHPGDASWPNRLFPLEQWSTQDQVEDWFLHWDKKPGLRASQCADCDYVAVSSVAVRTTEDAVQQELAAMAKRCSYTVREGDDLGELLAEAKVTLEEVVFLNRGELHWKPGQVVVLPRAICLLLVAKGTEQ